MYRKYMAQPHCGFTVIFRIMKLTVLLLTFSLIQVSAATRGQNISLNAKNISFGELISRLREQTNYDFIYSAELGQNEKNFNVHCLNKPLEEVLDNCLKEKALAFKISGSTVLIFNAAQDAKLVEITGIVKDDTGDVLPGVSVKVKGQTQGVTTDVRGAFRINVPTENSTLVFVYVGFRTQEIQLKGQRTLSVAMQSESQNLNEVVVIGYGVQRKSDMTGSVTTIKSGEITGIRSGNAAEVLQGKSGLTVTTSGTPGASPVVRIRGIGTNANSNPLYVVDGMMTNDIVWLNPNDIDNISVLKDASATAIYGSRGANGVILITTKSGKPGRTVFNYSGTEGVQYKISDFEVANGTQYAEMMNKVASYTNAAAPYANPAQYGNGTNWMDEISRSAKMREHQFGVYGGSENVKYNLSVGYLKQEGIWNSTQYDRWTIRANNEYKLNSKVKVGHNLGLSLANSGQGLAYRNMLSVLSASPLISPQNDNGGWNSMQNLDLINPAAELALNKDFNFNDQRFVGSVWGSWEIIKGLTFLTNLGDDYYNNYTRHPQPIYDINSSHQRNLSNRLREFYGNGNTYIWTNTLTYDKKISDKHYLNLLAGYTTEQSKVRGLGANGQGYTVYDLDYMSIASTPGSITNKTVETQMPVKSTRMSYMFRTNYTLMDRYMLTATMRADGSSKFGTNNVWGYFPSAALGWRVSEESFLKDVSWLNNLKLRASWGVTGNDKIVDYVSYALVSQFDEFHAVFNGQVRPAAGITKAFNPDVKWERNEQKDFGVEMAFLNNRLTAELDFWSRDTKDLLMELPVRGGSVGIAPTFTNSGEVRNSGYDFTLGWRENKKSFKYGASFTGSSFKNKVTDWKEIKSVVGADWWISNQNVMYEGGKPFGYIYGYKTQGIYRSQADLDSRNAYATQNGKAAYHPSALIGDLIYQDVDGDGTITPADRTDLGSVFPKFTGSLNLNAEFKGFDIALDFAGSFGAKILNAMYNSYSQTSNNMHADWLDAWSASNPNGNMPRLGSINMNRTLDLNVMKGDYVKLRSLMFGYTLPNSLVNQARINKVRVFFTGSNLLYFTKYKGFTPELINGIDTNSYPMSGSAQFGVNVTF